MKTDFDAQNHLSFWLLRPLTPRAQAHAAERYCAATTWGDAVVVEGRYIRDNARRLLADGYRVSIHGRPLRLH